MADQRLELEKVFLVVWVRVRVCAADNCAWLFLDKSRNRTRQRCDMSVCGNRAKARRHYRRSKAVSTA
jgi:predicted RNA-binding Zn ribbon-like protein